MIEKLTEDQRGVLEALPSGRKALSIIDQLQDALDKERKLTQEALEFSLAAVDRLKKAGK